MSLTLLILAFCAFLFHSTAISCYLTGNMKVESINFLYVITSILSYCTLVEYFLAKLMDFVFFIFVDHAARCTGFSHCHHNMSEQRNLNSIQSHISYFPDYIDRTSL